MSSSPADVSRKALTLRDLFLALLVGGQLAIVPGEPLIGAWRAINPQVPEPVLTLRDTKGREYARPVRDVLRTVSRMGFQDAFPIVHSFAQAVTIVEIGDQIRNGSLHDPSEPLLEFVRHYRNAAAHGNRWHLVGNEPKRPAQFDSLQVVKAWHGDTATDKILPFHHVRLLEAISAHFGPPADPNTSDTWRYYRR